MASRPAPGTGRVVSPVPPRTVHLPGATKSVTYARTLNGNEPAKEFYDDLSSGDQDKFDNLFLRWTEHGNISNPEKFKSNVGGICCNLSGTPKRFPVAEFKIHTGKGKRILAILDGNEYVLVNGFEKGGVLANEVLKAGRIFCEDLSRRSITGPKRGAQ